jgi:hypothetical protein
MNYAYFFYNLDITLFLGLKVNILMSHIFRNWCYFLTYFFIFGE